MAVMKLPLVPATVLLRKRRGNEGRDWDNIQQGNILEDLPTCAGNAAGPGPVSPSTEAAPRSPHCSGCSNSSSSRCSHPTLPASHPSPALPLPGGQRQPVTAPSPVTPVCQHPLWREEWLPPPASEHWVSYCHSGAGAEPVPLAVPDDVPESFGSGRGGVGGGTEEEEEEAVVGSVGCGGAVMASISCKNSIPPSASNPKPNQSTYWMRTMSWTLKLPSSCHPFLPLSSPQQHSQPGSLPGCCRCQWNCYRWHPLNGPASPRFHPPPHRCQHRHPAGTNLLERGE